MMNDQEAYLAMRTAIQKVATGPEYSKDLSVDEAYASMRAILEGKADDVQSAVYFIALRMKRETAEENEGVLKAILENATRVTAEVDEVVDISDPYDGYARGVPASPFLSCVLAACGVPAISHGADSIGPKYGCTHRKVLREAGINVDISVEEAAKRLEDSAIGWAYVDQRAFSPALHNLVDLRSRMVKRQVLTTVEVLTNPIRGRKKTHLLTGYVHKAYPPVYARLARQAGFDSAMIVRGVEGGVIPSLQQAGKFWFYHDMGEEQPIDVDPSSIGIKQENRAVPLPKDLPGVKQAGDGIASEIDIDALAKVSAKMGIAALEGAPGPMYDSLVYAAATCLHHLGRYDSLASAADGVREVLNSGAALKRFKAAL